MSSQCDKRALLSWLVTFRADSGIPLITSVTMSRGNAFPWKRENGQSRRNMRQNFNLWLVNAIPIKYLNPEFQIRVVFEYYHSWYTKDLAKNLKESVCIVQKSFEPFLKLKIRKKTKTNKKTPTKPHQPSNQPLPKNPTTQSLISLGDRHKIPYFEWDVFAL